MAKNGFRPGDLVFCSVSYGIPYTLPLRILDLEPPVGEHDYIKAVGSSGQPYKIKVNAKGTQIRLMGFFERLRHFGLPREPGKRARVLGKETKYEVLKEISIPPTTQTDLKRANSGDIEKQLANFHF